MHSRDKVGQLHKSAYNKWRKEGDAFTPPGIGVRQTPTIRVWTSLQLDTIIFLNLQNQILCISVTLGGLMKAKFIDKISVPS